MDQINTEILRQFENQGLTINEGVAIDARLVKSASRLISNDKIKELKDQKSTPEGNLDKNGKSLKFSRDFESDWTIKNDKPHCHDTDPGFSKRYQLFQLLHCLQPSHQTAHQ